MAERMEVRRPKRRAEEGLEEVMITLDICDQVAEQNKDLAIAKENLNTLIQRKADMQVKLDQLHVRTLTDPNATSDFRLTVKDYVDIVAELQEKISNSEAYITEMEKERMELLREQMENELRSSNLHE